MPTSSIAGYVKIRVFPKTKETLKLMIIIILDITYFVYICHIILITLDEAMSPHVLLARRLL